MFVAEDFEIAAEPLGRHGGGKVKGFLQKGRYSAAPVLVNTDNSIVENDMNTSPSKFALLSAMHKRRLLMHFDALAYSVFVGAQN